MPAELETAAGDARTSLVLSDFNSPSEATVHDAVAFAEPPDTGAGPERQNGQGQTVSSLWLHGSEPRIGLKFTPRLWSFFCCSFGRRHTQQQ